MSVQSPIIWGIPARGSAAGHQAKEPLTGCKPSWRRFCSASWARAAQRFQPSSFSIRVFSESSTLAASDSLRHRL
jgi:hypothetical protein